MAAADGTAAAVPTIGDLFDLRGRVAVVTGAGSGIGRAVARRLSEAGARVLAADLSEAAATTTVEQLAVLGGEALPLGADVRRAEDADRTAAAAVDAWGRVDVLVNCAGIFPAAPVMDAPAELWDDVLRINTTGTFLTSRACARAMADAGGGAIVNLASKSAFQPTRGMAHYAASKGAVAMLTKALALELAPMGIRVNAVAPGAIHTEGSERAAAGLGAGTRSAAEVVAVFQARCPLGREGDPDEIARVVLFLATAASSYMTGSVVLADGGYLLT